MRHISNHNIHTLQTDIKNRNALTKLHTHITTHHDHEDQVMTGMATHMREHLLMVMGSNTMTSDHLDKADIPSKRRTRGGGIQADRVMNTIEAERRQKIEGIGHNIQMKMNTITVRLGLEGDQVLPTIPMMRRKRMNQSTGINTSSHDEGSHLRMNFTTNI